jgi:hypothetical protein
MTSEQDREDTTDGALARRLAIGAALLANVTVLVAVFALNSEEPHPDSQAGNTT